MNYQIWTKEGYADAWERKDCGDLPAAEREIDAAVRRGEEPLLTVEVPYKINIKISPVGEEPPKKQLIKTLVEKRIKEGANSEADKDKAGPGEDTGAESPG